MRSNRLTILAWATVLLLAGNPAVGQKLYKWVDKDGNVHYSDQVPPDQVDQAREELSNQGVVVDSIARAPTAEELQQQRDETLALETERKRLEKLQKEDDKLLRMYDSETEIIRSKEQQVDAINRSIVASQAYINGQSKSLANLMARAAQMESQGQTVSEALTSSIEDVRSQLGEQEDFVNGRESEKVKIVEQYEVLLARYREVKQRND